LKTAATDSRVTGEAEPPGPLYCDASALVKLYVPESDSGDLNRRVEGRRDLLVSDLSITEIASSLGRRRREGSLTAAVALRLHRTLLKHVERGLYRRVELVPATHREAERLLLAIQAIPLRAADALHVALAIAGDAASIVTFDRRLADAARSVGLTAFP
jgi:predicted nucleic acid-binding protein